MANGNDRSGGSEPLKTATAAVGLLAGLVAAVYVLGGLVIAMRMLRDEFTPNSISAALGQLPREVVVATALLEVIAPAIAIGVIAAMIYGLFNGPTLRAWRNDELNQGPHWRLFLVLFLLIAIILVAPTLIQLWETDGFSIWFVFGILGIFLMYGLVATGWFVLRQIGRRDPPRFVKALMAGAVWAVLAAIPAATLASLLPFEKAQVCTTTSVLPETGRLIGEGEGRILLGQKFLSEVSVLSLPADKMTRAEYGDISSTFACPLPAGAAEEAKAAVETLDGHGGRVEQRLATKLRPRLFFDSRERWRPLAVDTFVAERYPGGAGHGACMAAEDPPCPDVEGLELLRRRPGAPAYVDIYGKARDGTDAVSPDPACRMTPPAVDCNRGPTAAIYYRRTSHEGRWYWDYWWFMRYNDYTGNVNRCLIICGDHEGDWEGVTVITTPSLEPEIIGSVYATHRERILIDGASLPLAGGHPRVYVAAGTHAGYPFKCRGGCRQYSTALGVHLPEDPHDGTVPWGGNGDAECARSQCVRPLPEVGHPAEEAMPLAGAWAGWPGRWGETCHAGCSGFRGGHESSPNSPGVQARFACPWVATRRALPTVSGEGLADSEPLGDTLRLLAACTAQRGF